MRLTPLDELKFTAVIQRTTTVDAGALVLGMKCGTDMRSSENTYRQDGETQNEVLLEALLNLRYARGFPVDNNTKFKTAVKDYQFVGGELASRQIATLFKQSFNEKA